jgi:hypothetical protein
MTDLAETIGLLRAAFPRQDFPPVSVQVYARALKDLDPALVQQAVVRLCQREDWLPSIAKIRRECAEVALRLPSVTEAWLMAQTPVGRAGAPPPVKAAVEAVGGPYSFRIADAEQLERRFQKAYRELREAEIRSYAESAPGPSRIGSGLSGTERAAAPVTGAAIDSAPDTRAASTVGGVPIGRRRTPSRPSTGAPAEGAE